MKNFYYKLNSTMFASLYFSLIGFLVLYLLNALGFQPRILVWPLILYAAYFFVVFFLTFITRKLRYILVDDMSLWIFIGPLWARKYFNFRLETLRAAIITRQKVKKDELHTQWGNTYLTTERKVLSLEFKNKITEDQIKLISSIQKRNILTSPIEVSNDGSALLVTEEPRGGFDSLLESINKELLMGAPEDGPI